MVLRGLPPDKEEKAGDRVKSALYRHNIYYPQSFFIKWN